MQTQLTESDKKLINQAYRMCWEDVCNLEKLAQSTEAKEELKTIRMRKYHNEEYSCGLL